MGSRRKGEFCPVKPSIESAPAAIVAAGADFSDGTLAVVPALLRNVSLRGRARLPFGRKNTADSFPGVRLPSRLGKAADGLDKRVRLSFRRKSSAGRFEPNVRTSGREPSGGAKTPCVVGRREGRLSVSLAQVAQDRQVGVALNLSAPLHFEDRAGDVAFDVALQPLV